MNVTDKFIDTAEHSIEKVMLLLILINYQFEIDMTIDKLKNPIKLDKTKYS